MRHTDMINFKTTEPDISVPADEKTLMRVFDLPLLEARFLQAMLNTKEWIGGEELPAAKYSTRQIVYRLRMKLEAADPRIWVVNDGNKRYSVTPTGKLAIKEIIEKSILQLSESQ